MLTTPLFFQHHGLTLSDPVSLNLRGQSSGAVQTTNDLPAGCISVSPQSQTPFKGMFSCAQSMLSHGQTSVIGKEHGEAEEPLLVQITLKGQWYNDPMQEHPTARLGEHGAYTPAEFCFLVCWRAGRTLIGSVRRGLLSPPAHRG